MSVGVEDLDAAQVPGGSPAITAWDLAYRAPLNPALKRIVNDALSAGRVLVVSTTRHAKDLAAHVTATDADVVEVVDDTDTVRGYVFPPWIAGQVTIYMQRRPQSFAEAVDILTEQRRQPVRDHLHEWLNFATPSPVVCPGGPPGSIGRHFTFGAVPCRNHR